MIAEARARLMLAEQVRGLGVEAAEVVEAQRLPVDEPVSIRRARDRTLVEVPVGHVHAGVAQHRGALECVGHKVEPPLVDEVSKRVVDHAVIPQPLLPPAQQLADALAGGHGDEAQVVDARRHQVELTRLASVVGDGCRYVRREH